MEKKVSVFKMLKTLYAKVLDFQLTRRFSLALGRMQQEMSFRCVVCKTVAAAQSES